MEQDVSVFSDMMQLNYMGTVHVLKAALPGLVQRGEGHVVLVASVMAVIGAHQTLQWQDSGWWVGMMRHVLQVAHPTCCSFLDVSAGFTGYASYAPSKWAVRGLCDCLRNEVSW
jgi:3-dehydrosphinganine reductase